MAKKTSRLALVAHWRRGMKGRGGVAVQPARTATACSYEFPASVALRAVSQGRGDSTDPRLGAALVAFLLRHSSSLSIVAFLRHSLVDNAIAEWPIMRACHAGCIVAIERQAVVVEVAQRRRAPQPARTPPALPLERRQCLGPASRSPRVV